MDNIIYCEFLKLKRSKIRLVGFLGSIVTPLLAVMNEIRRFFSNTNYEVSLFSLYDNVFMFLMLLFGPLVFSIIASYLFSREYTEKTLKTLFTVPVSKKHFLAGKFITLLLCILFLMILTWAEVLVLAGICGLVLGGVQFSIGTAIVFFFKMVLGGILLFAVITPVAFLAVVTKGFMIPIIAAAVISLGNVIATNSPIAGFFPWSSAYLIVSGRMKGSGTTPEGAVMIIAILCLLSISASIHHFQKEDII